MDAREERGLEIAATMRLRKEGSVWIVPSQTGKNRKYSVNLGGVKTNIITAVEIHDRNASDTKLLPAMIGAAAQNFRVSEVSADKGYATISNTNAIAGVGATPYIAFKSINNGAGGGLWGQMYHYFMFRRDEFLQHYHKRSNIESTFSMIKRKFGDSLRSKTDVAMVNETLCKVICHNLVVLIHETHELGIDPVFWAETPVAQEVLCQA